jgi:deazaflavin-dependent oxidoreductase (nitroreductase family)
MVLPRGVAKFNRRVTNKVLGRIAPIAPGFAMIEHVGRKSGRTYHTPINLFRTEDGYVAALTYGPSADWVRNVLAAGECYVVLRGKRVHMVAPHVEHDPRRKAVPPPARQFLGLVGVRDFLVLHTD